MKTILPSFIENYTSYVSKLPLSKDVINILLENDEINENPLFYLEYASLFENSFKFKNSSNKIISLNVAGFLCYKYSLLMDSLLDKETKQGTLALSNIYLEESIKILTSLFGLDNKFWRIWNTRKKEFYDASKIGKVLFHKKEVSLIEYENLCDQKSAMGKVAIDSLFILSKNGNNEVYNKLIDSHKLFSIGFQINDDIEDFIEDFRNNDFNFAYYNFSKYSNEVCDNMLDKNKLLYLSGFATDLYKLSLSYFQKSKLIAAETKESKWIEVISGKIKETESAIDSIEEYLKIVVERVSLKEKAIKIKSFNFSIKKDSEIEKGLNYLIEEWEIDFPEIKHTMVLSNSEGFNNKASLHTTDIFQRGILANNLIDISKNYKIDLSEIINCEIEYLIENRNKDEIGGWSYFPSVKEIAADADDLGQMMQVFIKGNRKYIIDEYCLSSIRVLIGDCYHSNTGGIETWIIPKANRSNVQKIQYEFNSNKWGSGPHIEVMANFLYALLLDNYNLYKDIIVKGTKYIFSNISEGFFWNSRWYYGWLYGTMLCVRLSIELFKHNSILKEEFEEIISKIKHNIIQNQNKDGGWAIEFNGKSDPLNTSFALYTLMLLDTIYEKSIPLERGIQFLNKTQNSDGSWVAIHFIKPKVNEPYKSKVITTSYALNTLTLYNERVSVS